MQAALSVLCCLLVTSVALVIPSQGSTEESWLSVRKLGIELHRRQQTIRRYGVAAVHSRQSTTNVTAEAPTPASVTNTSSCDTMIENVVTQLRNSSACMQLIAHLDSDCMDTEFICSNVCWDQILAAALSLRDAGCDVGDIPDLCSPAFCQSDEATGFTLQWLADGCVHMDHCHPFMRCALMHSTECPPVVSPPSEIPTNPSPSSAPLPPPSPVPVRLTCPNNCSHHGTCERRNGTVSLGRCKCDKGYGRSSPLAVQDCSEFTLSMCPNMCNGHGVCVPAENDTMACECFDGFSGPDCRAWSRCADLAFCSSHGQCSTPYAGPLYAPQPTCVCNPGFSGPDCATRTTPGVCPAHCSGRGTCVTQGSASHCECDDHYSGSDCRTFQGAVCPDNCSGHGACNATGACVCNRGFTGASCGSVIQACLAGCRNGFCSRNATCKCVQGFSGELCDVYNAQADPACTALSMCSGFGVCNRAFNKTDRTYQYSCVCFEGFSGETCSQVDADHPNECPRYCSGHGVCVLLPSPHCQCAPGWNGSDCATSLCGLHSGVVCGGRGVCEIPAGSQDYACACDAGYQSGAAGTCEVSRCDGDCSGNGRCVGPNTCKCNSGYSGVDCSTAPTAVAVAMVKREEGPSSRREDEEDSPVVDASMCLNACKGRGQCMMGKCVCRSGYTGDDCSTEMPSVYEEPDGLDSVDLLEIRSDAEPSMAALF